MPFYTVYNTLNLQILIFSIFYSVSKNSYNMTTINIANPQLYRDRKYQLDGRMWAGCRSRRSNSIHTVPVTKHVCTCLHVYARVCTYMHVSVHVYTCLYVSVHVSTCLYVPLSVSTCLYVSLCVSMCLYMSLGVSMCLYVSLRVSTCQYMSVIASSPHYIYSKRL